MPSSLAAYALLPLWRCTAATVARRTASLVTGWANALLLKAPRRGGAVKALELLYKACRAGMEGPFRYALQLWTGGGDAPPCGVLPSSLACNAPRTSPWPSSAFPCAASAAPRAFLPFPHDLPRHRQQRQRHKLQKCTLDKLHIRHRRRPHVVEQRQPGEKPKAPHSAKGRG